MDKKSKEYINAYNKAWYQKNKKRRIELNLKSILKKQKVVSDIKMERGCVECGYNEHPQALDFDHVSDDKKGNVSTMIRDNLSMASIMAEIAKCEIVCANCHRIRTFNRRLLSSIG